MKEVTSMKTFITITAMVVLTLAFGVAYADEFPITNGRDVGTELYLNAFPVHDTTARVVTSKDFSAAGGRPSDKIGEIGTVMYNDAFLAKDTMMGSAEVRGSAAGGMAKDDENTRIWDNLLGAPGGSDLP